MIIILIASFFPWMKDEIPFMIIHSLIIAYSYCTTKKMVGILLNVGCYNLEE